ncbi:Ni/Co efflux regulator RcnB|uniref:Ni/Co efflux regulator RcnB n=1 Tax=Brenneria salicis ATCC 15712 = DSM 30166 TaxID=714314 RepID=A0A366IBS2_9GAMM|nr:RcnB family protein [Brenneria salicis]NMN92413.1 Ni/Co efflux regulator RcnB [Brenneria salicis ATCC 15712 = DSM 30166]RBP67757.1 Ni/Co efflux regulator RcnB [Brenneria salicis ATCC 15712 = DSM 30166]RLM32526.1 hypothetical protein BHG07_00130 [Brenneria salicis ATCC 15712 = DSM 30166]
MNKKILALVAAMFTVTSGFSTVSWAEGPGGQQGDQRQLSQPGQQKQQVQREGERNQRQSVRSGANANDVRGGDRRGRAGAERDHFSWNGRDFRKGHAVPKRFRGDDYRVTDWRDRGLYKPPSGQHWAYIDGNYVLIAAATGIITTILLNSMLNN